MTEGFKIPRFRLPGFVSAIGVKLPQWPHAVALTAGLNAVAKMGLLPQDSLELLENRTFFVDVLDTGGQASFTYRNGLFRPFIYAPEESDLTFRANFSAFLQLLARQEDPDTLFFNRELSIEGDTELGLIVKNMLDAVEWPQLPDLSKLPRLSIFRH